MDHVEFFLALLGALVVASFLLALLTFSLWTAIEYAMKIAKFTPLFIAWRYAEAEKARGQIITTKAEKKL